MTNARDKANIPVLNFQSKGIDDNATSTALTINSNETVEITSSEQELLYLNSSHATNCKIKLQGGYHSNLFSQITESAGAFIIDVDPNGQEAGSNFKVKIGGSEKIRLNSTGLGIGTSSPTTALEIRGSTPQLSLRDSSGHGSIISWHGGVDALGRHGIYYGSNASNEIDINEFGNIYFSPGKTGGSNPHDGRKITMDTGGNISTTGRFLSSNGTASLPSLGFANDTNTGIFRASGDTLGFTTGGSERMRITSTGLGIGTSSPVALLTVGSNNSGGQGVAGKQALFSGTNTSTYNAGNSGTWGGITIVNQDNTSNRTGTGITFINRSSSSGLAGIQSTNDGTAERADLRFITRGAGGTVAERMRIDDDGHVICPEGVTLGTAVGTYVAANTLEDYEEGTWTPSIQASGTHYSSVTHTVQNGRYTKIGRQVFAHFRVTISAVTIGSASGNINVEGLPFTCSSADSTNQAGTVSYVSNVNFNLSSFGTLNIGLNAYQNQDKGGIVRSRNSGTADGLHNSSIGSATDIVGTFIYFVN